MSTRVYLPDETGDVDVDKGGHEVLAVEAVHDASVTRDRVGKILRGNRSSARAFTTGQLEQLELIIFSKCRTTDMLSGWAKPVVRKVWSVDQQWSEGDPWWSAKCRLTKHFKFLDFKFSVS